ncbi:MAG: hypothetical protein DRO88_01495 [Promethearchaeia archaeon]|nr:MAG: hypothetical protein DRO88_01495 [Candidatus Lokiarchaeia archaeon]
MIKNLHKQQLNQQRKTDCVIMKKKLSIFEYTLIFTFLGIFIINSQLTTSIFAFNMVAEDIPNGNANEIHINTGESFIWNTTRKDLTDYSYLERWDITKKSNDGLYANIFTSNDGNHWISSLMNDRVIYFYPEGGFSIHQAGPKLVPVPINATSLILQIEGTWAYFLNLEFTTWNWDGRILRVWNNYAPEIGDVLENYYLEVHYNNDGVLLQWNETFSINGQYYQILTNLVSRGGKEYVPASSEPITISFPSYNNLTASISVATSDAVNFSLSISNPSDFLLNGTPSQMVALLELNCSDPSKVNFPVTLSIQYTDEQLEHWGLSIETLAFWYLNDSGNWEELPTKAYQDSHRIEVQLSHFSTYGLAEGTPELVKNRTNAIPGYGSTLYEISPLLFILSIVPIIALIYRLKRTLKIESS